MNRIDFFLGVFILILINAKREVTSVVILIGLMGVISLKEPLVAPIFAVEGTYEGLSQPMNPDLPYGQPKSIFLIHFFFEKYLF